MKYLLKISLAFLFASITTNCNLPDIPDRNPPKASFSIQDNGCEAPCNVAFNNSSEGAESYSWDFGDGSAPDDAANPTHLYQEEGTYVVVLTVKASDPSETLTDTARKQVTILRSATDPFGSFSVDKTACAAPCEVLITNNSRNTTSYSWDFGDGTTGNQTDSSFTHSYPDQGMYIINMTATGPNGSDDAEPVMVNVTAPVPPVAAFEVDSVNHNGFAPSLVVFKNTAVDADTYSWDFGDPASGIYNTSTDENPSHNFRNSGLYKVKLTVRNSLNGLEDDVEMDIDVKEPVTFIRQYDGGGDDYGVSITQNPHNGEYAITGYTKNGLYSDLYFLTTDSTGSLLLDETFGVQSSSERGNGIIINSAGEYVMTGYNSATGTKLWLLILDDKASILTDAKFDEGTGSTFGYSIIPTFSGEYAIAGSMTNGPDNDFWLLVTDKDKNISVNKHFDGGGEDDDKVNAIIQTSTGGYAMIGTSFGATNSILLVVTDGAGSNPFSKVYAGESGNSLVETPNGGFAITGLRNGKMLILITDASGGLLISKEYPETTGSARGSDIIRTMDGGYAVVGWGHGGSNEDVYLVVTDANGNKLLDKFFPVGSSNDLGFSIIQTADGGFAITGRTSNGSDGDVLLIKTDANGNVN